LLFAAELFSDVRHEFSPGVAKTVSVVPCTFWKPMP
jgi:hypothetical protein